MKPFLLLHGAIGSSAQLVPLKTGLEKHFKDVLLFDFPGHGGKKISDEGFSISFFAESVVKFLDENKIQQANIFGYSMGGYVALYLARHYPGKIFKIMTLGTKLEWTEEIAAKEIKLLDPEKILQKIPAFADALQKRHSPGDWKVVLKKTAEMMVALGKNPELKKEDFLQIKNEVLLAIGDRDNMVTKEETMEVYSFLSHGSFEILHDTPHPIEQVELKKIVSLAGEFYRN